MTGRVSGECWAQILPRTYSWDRRRPIGLRVVRITQRRPRSPEPGCLLVKLRLTLPVGAFVPVELEALVDVGPDAFELAPATVEAMPL